MYDDVLHCDCVAGWTLIRIGVGLESERSVLALGWPALAMSVQILTAFTTHTAIHALEKVMPYFQRSIERPQAKYFSTPGMHHHYPDTDYLTLHAEGGGR